MFVVMWEYEVRPGREDAFAALYGAEGEWVALFARHPGYIATELWRDAAAPTRFVTLDRWTCERDYDAFLTAAKPQYAQIDARGDALTTAERCLGRFSSP